MYFYVFALQAFWILFIRIKKKSMCLIGIVTDFLVILWTNKT